MINQKIKKDVEKKNNVPKDKLLKKIHHVLKNLKKKIVVQVLKQNIKINVVLKMFINIINIVY